MRQLEEALDIGDVFAASITLPRQTAEEAELPPRPMAMTARTSVTCMTTFRRAFSVSSDEYSGFMRHISLRHHPDTKRG